MKIFSIFMIGLILHELLSSLSQKTNLHFYLFESPLKNRFNLSGGKREKETIALINQWRNEMKEKIENERREKIYRQHLVNRVQGSILKDFFTLRYF